MANITLAVQKEYKCDVLFSLLRVAQDWIDVQKIFGSYVENR